ncbi:putative endonuclease [Kaistella antarctica]|nr:putative endonuclease [Kaistella antarctica]
MGDFFLMKYYVYILYSESLDVYYKGFSTDVEKRLEYHLNSQHKFTSKTKDWVIVNVQEFEEKQEALQEENRLKKLNRKSIGKLIG